jgi:DNA-binding GntR family transcriptional regulator
MTPPGRHSAFEHLSIEPQSTVDRVAEELRRAVLEGELPPGTPLREVALAESLQVSRSTVREALGALVAEGLADRVPNRGTQVRALDPEAIHDVSRARAVIEMAGLERWPEASDDARAAVRAALAAFAEVAGTRASASELTAAHLGIHAAIAGLTESPRLSAMAETLYTEIKLALANVDRIRGNAAEQVHSHTDLVELLEGGRLDEAATELRHHLEGAERSMLDSLGWQREHEEDGR